MRATGIIRRVDDLGCIVIPRDIRKQMNIRDGEAMEIYTDVDTQMVCFQVVKPPKISVGDELQRIYNRHKSELSAVSEGIFNALIQSVNSEED